MTLRNRSHCAPSSSTGRPYRFVVMFKDCYEPRLVGEVERLGIEGRGLTEMGCDAVSLARCALRLPMLLAVLLVTLAACGDGEATETTDGTDTTAAATQSIEGPPWRLAEARGLEVPQELSLTIQFQDGRSPVSRRATGSAGLRDRRELVDHQRARPHQEGVPERLTEVDTVLVRTLRRVAAYSLTVPDSNCSTPTSGWFSPTGRLVPPTCRDGGWSSVCSTATKKLLHPHRGNNDHRQLQARRPVAGERRVQQLLGQLRGAGEHHLHRRRRGDAEGVCGAQGTDGPREPCTSRRSTRR